MPKTLSAATTTATGRRDADVILLVKIELTAPSAKTLWLSDAFRNEIGQEFLPFVLGFGSVDEAQNEGDVGGRTTTATLRLHNSKLIEGKTRLSSLIRTPGNLTGTYEFTFAKVTVSELLFSGAAPGDEVVLGVFFLEDCPDINEEWIDFRMSDAALVLEDKMKIWPLTNDTFPLADPDDIGKDIAVPIGINKNVVCLACVAGWRSSSSTAITAAVPAVGGWLTVSDDKAPTSGVGQIDDEQIEWNAKQTVGGLPQVRISRRGINGTTAAPHAAGAGLWQVRSGLLAYGYLVGENVGAFTLAPGTVTNVRVNNVLQTNVTVDYAYTTPTAPGRSFVVIWFPALPVLRRQVTIGINDQIGVSDTIAVSSPSLTTVKVASTTNPVAAIANPNTSPALGTQWYSSALTVAFPNVTGVQTVIYAVIVTVNGGISADRFQILVNGNLVVDWPVGPASPTTWALPLFGSNNLGPVEVRVRWKTYSVHNTSWRLSATADAAAAIVVNRTGAASKTGTVSLTGNSTADVVIGGQVTCDVAGPLRVPADAAQAMLLHLFPGVTAGDLGTSWATTRTLHANGAYRWDIMLTKHRMSELRRKIGEQCRSALYIEGGKWELRLITTSPAPAAQITLDYLTDFWDGEPGKVARTPRTDIRNSLTVYAGRDYRKTGGLGDRYTIARVIENLTGFADRLGYDLELDFVQDVITATSVANVWLEHWKRQRLVVDATVLWKALAAEKYDVVSIANHPILTDMAPAGVYRIIGRSYRLADADNPARIHLRMIEANP